MGKISQKDASWTQEGKKPKTLCDLGKELERVKEKGRRNRDYKLIRNIKRMVFGGGSSRGVDL